MISDWINVADFILLVAILTKVYALEFRLKELERAHQEECDDA